MKVEFTEEMKLHSLKIDDGEEKNSVVSASADLALTAPP